MTSCIVFFLLPALIWTFSCLVPYLFQIRFSLSFFSLTFFLHLLSSSYWKSFLILSLFTLLFLLSFLLPFVPLVMTFLLLLSYLLSFLLLFILPFVCILSTILSILLLWIFFAFCHPIISCFLPCLFSHIFPPCYYLPPFFPLSWVLLGHALYFFAVYLNAFITSFTL